MQGIRPAEAWAGTTEALVFSAEGVLWHPLDSPEMLTNITPLFTTHKPLVYDL